MTSPSSEVVTDASSSPTTPLLAEENDRTNSDEHATNHNDDSTRRSWLALLCAPLTDERGHPAAVAAGLGTLCLVGGLWGALVVPHDAEIQHPAWYRVVSAAVGYTYFLAWSVSFYPQVLTNWRRRNTQGLSVDFCLLNVLGFACYTAYTVALYSSPAVRREYRARQHTPGIPVESNDVAFCVHATVLSAVTVGQMVWYGQTTLLHQVRPVIGRFMVALVLWIVVLGPLLVVSGVWHWLDYLYSLSFIKVLISLVKYIPQVLLNRQRQSTEGWSIWQILLDLTGGCLSDVQLVGDTWAKTQPGASVWRAVVTGNPAKLALGSLSMAFDVVFMVQHYILYPSTETAPVVDETTQGLVEDGENQPDNNEEDDDDEADEVSSTQALNGACPADQCRLEEP